ncbi:MAG: hypothetical protein OFPII_03800 [Osedax symbiont Rs1]|nr:MAG: hypothetical protein OFPII_03800 [Osedax symbiont Rs1]
MDKSKNHSTQTAVHSSAQDCQLLCWSAASASQLQQTVAAFVENQPQQCFALDDIAFTLQQGRRALSVRYTQVQQAAVSMTLISEKIMPVTAGTPQLVWVFAGQGTQFSGMLTGLYQSIDEVREVVDHCCEILRRFSDVDLLPLLLVASEEHDQQLHNTSLAQPALFIQAVAQVTLWRQLGLQPVISFGHSLGEYCAAWQAGVWSLEVVLELVCRRGQLMASAAAGAMLACRCDENTLQKLPASVQDLFDIAAFNGRQRTVLSVVLGDLAMLSEALMQADIPFRRLDTSHAFHSRMMEPLLADFYQLLKKSAPQRPQQLWLSNLTGQPITADQATNPDYWCQHLRQPVQFSRCAQTTLQLYPKALFLEIGPGQNMIALLAEESAPLFASARGRHSNQHYIDWLDTVGQLWQQGIDIDWQGFVFQQHAGRVPLPGTALNPVYCWADVADTCRRNAEVSADQKIRSVTSAAPVRQRLEQVWCRVLGVAQVAEHDSFFSLGGNSIHLLEMTRLAAGQELKFSVAQAYEYPQFDQLCAFLERQGDADAVDDLISDAAPAPFSLCALDDSHFERILQQVCLQVTLADAPYANTPQSEGDCHAKI